MEPPTTERLGLAEWAEAHRVLDGRVFSFRGHEYLRELYDDAQDARHVVLMKGSQMGGTEYALSRVLWMLDTEAQAGRRRRAIYYFPYSSDVMDFSRDRFTAAVNDSPYLGSIVGPELGAINRAPTGDRPGAIRESSVQALRSVRGSRLYFRGMLSRGSRIGETGAMKVKSIPGDMLVFDELDEAPQAAREQAIERVGHSDLRWVIELSTPTYPGSGIDIPWQQSDQRHWHLDCLCSDGCCVDDAFPACVDDTGELRCPACSEVLDRAEGHWVAHAESEIRGYRISQLYSSTHGLRGIVERYQAPGDHQQVMNHALARPHRDGTRTPFPRELVEGCCRPREMETSGTRTYCGIDVGSDLFYVVIASRGADGSMQVIWVGEVSTATDEHGAPAELYEVLSRYDVAVGVVDAQPETHTVQRIIRDHPSRMVRCRYEQQHVRSEWQHSKRTVCTDRTTSLDDLRTRYVAGGIELPSPQIPAMQTLIAHHAAFAIEYVESGQTRVQRKVYRDTGADHFAHAVNYCHIAFQRPTPGVA